MNILMKDKRKSLAKSLAKSLSSDSRIGRAQKLADASLPLVADLYVAHLNACATQRDGESKRRPRRKPAER